MDGYKDLVVCGGRSHPAMTRAICEYLSVTETPIDLTPIDALDFSNGNIKVTVKGNVRNCDAFVVQTGARGGIDNRLFTPKFGESKSRIFEAFRASISGFNDLDRILGGNLIRILEQFTDLSSLLCNKDLVELLIIVDALKYASAARITVVMPYKFYVRSDKKEEARISVTAALVADLLMRAGIHRVVFIDLHAGQIQRYYGVPSDQLSAKPIFYEAVRELGLDPITIVTADEGRLKDSRKIAHKLGIDEERIVVPHKFRPDDTETPRFLKLKADVEKSNCLLFDDEILTGNTGLDTIGQLNQLGAAGIYSAATHFIASNGAAERFQDSPLTQLITTDTIPYMGTLPPKVVAKSVAPLLARAIRRIHDGRSVGRLIDELEEKALRGERLF